MDKLLTHTHISLYHYIYIIVICSFDDYRKLKYMVPSKSMSLYTLLWLSTCSVSVALLEGSEVVPRSCHVMHRHVTWPHVVMFAHITCHRLRSRYFTIITDSVLCYHLLSLTSRSFSFNMGIPLLHPVLVVRSRDVFLLSNLAPVKYG